MKNMVFLPLLIKFNYH